MTRLAQMGYPVVYLAFVGHYRHKARPMNGPLPGTPNLSVYTMPFAADVRKWRGVRRWLAGLRMARILSKNRIRKPVFWFYHPSLYSVAYSHDDAAIVYDVMDHFPSFEHSIDDAYFDELALLAEADVVFTGGNSLQRHAEQMIEFLLHDDDERGRETGEPLPQLSHRSPICLPSGVDLQHYSRALQLSGHAQRQHQPPTGGFCYGYFGAIDERIDWEILRYLAAQHPADRVTLAGPVLGALPNDLPPNIELVGPVPYDELPLTVSTFDVCMIPFKNTPLVQFVSPTKTPEYLAAGKPVVSTGIPDVVHDYGDVVRVADTPEDFTRGCVEAAQNPPPPDALAREAGTRARSWDDIAQVMAHEMSAAIAKNERATGSEFQQ